MLEREVRIINELGLHARASACLTQTAARYRSEVWVARKGRQVNGKSIMGVMMLAAAKGSSIVVTTEGEDEAEAMEAIVALIENKFGEAE